MYLHPSTITGLIDVLERETYVARVRDQKDRRVVKANSEGKKISQKGP